MHAWVINEIFFEILYEIIQYYNVLLLADLYIYIWKGP